MCCVSEKMGAGTGGSFVSVFRFSPASIIPPMLHTHLHIENCALLGHYAASIDYFLPTFRDKISVPSSGLKNPKKTLGWDR